MSHLRLLPPKPVGYCPAWHLRELELSEPLHGALCCFCGRDIAAPASARGKNVGCIYCGMENGDIPCTEVEPCRGPSNGLWLAGVDYNGEPYPAHIKVLCL